MRKAWSISTTVRNPDRVRGFLEVLKNFEGLIFDEKQQIKFQTALIQRKLYKPTDLNGELLKYYDHPSDMSEGQAKKVFEHMKNNSRVLRDDPGLRGRTSIAPLSKMGLVVAKKTVGKLYITNLGKKFLKKDFDMGEIFLEHFFKWTLPNPDSNHFSERGGFNIRPFIATLHIISGVNKRWVELGNDPKGISKQEFCHFVPTTINYQDIQKTIDEIIKLRMKTKGGVKITKNPHYVLKVYNILYTYCNRLDSVIYIY